MAQPEVLSPAGSWETLRAAVSAGADAVYFGGRQYNARVNATNFDGGELESAVAYCHARGVKAYITLNTMLFQNELVKALELARILCGAGVDAVIVQDYGLARLLHTAAPELRLHASTQMSVHNAAGARLLAGMGFQRIVAARELSKEELCELVKNSPAEIEVFVHGALCMSVSGQCYMSAMFGGRSGNRGSCAQPCRLPFSAPGGTGHDLSLKDLSLVTRMSELAQTGVVSLKIEGRMKRPEYVAAATDAVRRAVSGETVPTEELERLRSVFSRGGFTQGYFEAATGREMFGARGHEDVLASQGVLNSYRALYDGIERPRVPVRFHLTVRDGNSAELEATDGTHIEKITGMIPEKARTSALNETLVSEKLSKTGGTPFFTQSVSADLDSGLSIPVAELNRLRRQSLEGLLAQRSKPRPIPFDPPILKQTAKFSTGVEKGVENFFRIRLRSAEQLTKTVAESGAELIFLPVSCFREKQDMPAQLLKSGVRLGAEIPRAVFGGMQNIIEKDLTAAGESGIRDLLCPGPGAVETAVRLGFTAHGDFGLNVANAVSAAQLGDAGVSSLTLSFELTLGGAAAAIGAGAHGCGLIAYGRLPLMLTRNCPMKNGPGCQGCKKTAGLKDRLGRLFPVVCSGGVSEVLNDRPLWMCDRKRELYATGAAFVTLYFTTETPDEVDAVMNAWRQGLPPSGDFTRGLYYRGLSDK